MDLTFSLHLALSRCSLQIAQLLLDYGADLFKPSHKFSNSLNAATWGAFTNWDKPTCSVEFVLKKGVPINIKDNVHGGILHYAACKVIENAYGFQHRIWESSCEMLISRGGDINESVGKFGTPLQYMIHCAVKVFPNSFGHTQGLFETLEYFLQCVANPNVQSDANGTAFEFLDKLEMELDTEETRKEEWWNVRHRHLEICTRVVCKSVASSKETRGIKNCEADLG